MALGHSPQIVRDGLVLYLDAANLKSYPGSGTTIFNLNGNGNNGTLVNGVGHSGDNLGSLVFDGVNDRVQISSTSVIVGSLSSFSVDIWFNRTAVTDRFLYSETNESTGNPFWGITSNTNSINSSYLRLFARNNSGTGEQNFQPTTSGYNIYDNEWHNLILVYQSNLVTFYVDGVSVGSNTWTKGAYNSANRVNLGGWQFGASSGGHMNGKIPNIKTYNRALTVSEIKQNFNALRGRFGI